ncbi:NADP-dependent glyceraldehyde-3-phosphate dehydrogenase [Paraburkholderia phenoliruptrix]|uniref:Glyceraldehyde-3-phosphate dehydrogenase n=2 Tax=Paraburkholderia phenoliruptrix TaxID=252970 RepID=K0DQA6_9BURK|nr:NADP-dependent glyceraldehyde-3-phosphate dehydrogenase [Paraburkholderia phenoliruptrix]AFT86113.1 glyceraldehyde-3-phosphate dehydrogenase [Paraburkholderia phenoliruptrix BR3459a]CAB4048661.1 NADP-dependent glyceraldehyde-3-phosphate dehydrogenase [Paraburkholderia phenoliruptrix]
MTTNERTETVETVFCALESIPEACRIREPLYQRNILVDGELQPWAGKMRSVHSTIVVGDTHGRFSRVELGAIPDAGADEAFRALDAAEAAYDHGRGAWPTMRVAERIACVEDFTRQIISKRSEVIKLLMWEIGKTLKDSEKEFDRTITYIRDTIDELKKLDNKGAQFQVVEGTIGQIRRSPLGVTLCLGPYNYPMNETFTTLIPALIMGNVVLLKPPRFGVLLYAPMLEAFQSAFPKGVINMLYGNGAELVPALMATGRINVLALIGSSRVADQLKKAHPKSNRLRAVLGLDAKNAAIILPDADLELAVRECVAGSLSFNGQRCTAIKMIFVHRAVADEFVRRFSKAVGVLKCGMPWEDGVAITPLPDPGKCEYLSACIQDAQDHGAVVVNDGGGTVLETLFRPAVLYPVNSLMTVYREEQFGPVVPIAPFDDVEEALDYVVTSDYGQQVSIFGNEPAQIAKVVDALVNQVGRINLNTQCQRGPDAFPFAGRKDSAEGTLSVHDALRAFSIRSMVSAKADTGSKELIKAIVESNTSRFINTDFMF